MNILIIGGGGFIGQKLARALVEAGELRGKPITNLTLADVNMPPAVEGKVPVSCVTTNITERASVDALITKDADVIFLLAAVVSAHAEAEFEDGMNVNLFGAMNVFERVRTLGTNPVVVFTSSLAVFGGEVPDPIVDHTLLNPQSSYGTQKAIGEMLLNDYSRRGFLQGRGLRLPTIAVRPGKPNRAASSFMSSIIREPLNGQEAICPVGRDFLHYYLSPRRCVENLVKAADLDQEALGQNVNMMMPGRTLSIGDMIDAMTAVAGPEPAKLIRFEEQPDIQAIVETWRFDVRPEKSVALGLRADESFEENVRYYMQDDM